MIRPCGKFNKTEVVNSMKLECKMFFRLLILSLLCILCYASDDFSSFRPDLSTSDPYLPYLRRLPLSGVWDGAVCFSKNTDEIRKFQSRQEHAMQKMLVPEALRADGSNFNLAVAAVYARNPRPTVVVVAGEDAAERMAQALAAGPGDNITLVLIEITALDAETTVPLPQPPAEELSQTRRFEVSAARIAEQETQRRKHAHARRREIILTVAVVLAVLAAVIAALWLAVGSIPRKHPAPASTPVQTVAPTPTPASVNPPQIILPPPPTPEPEPTPEITPEPSPDTTHVPETAAPENLPG